MVSSNVKCAKSYIATLASMKNPLTVCLQQTQSDPQTDESFKVHFGGCFLTEPGQLSPPPHSPVSSLNAKLS